MWEGGDCTQNTVPESKVAKTNIPCVSSFVIRLHSIIGFRRRTGEGVHASKLGGREGETAVFAVYF